MKNKSFLIFISSLIIIFGGIYVSDLLGFFNTSSSSSLIEALDSEESVGDGVADRIESGEIRGSSTFEEIEMVFGVPATLIAEAFNIEAEEPGYLKALNVSAAFPDLGEEIEIGTGSVKIFVHLYTGQDVYLIEEIESFPSTAVDVLIREGKWSEEIETVLQGYIVEVNSPALTEEAVFEAAEEEHEEEESSTLFEINGKTTIQEIIDAGLTIEEIEAELGVSIPNMNLGLRDLCDQNGLSFSTEKNNFLAMLSLD